MNVPIRLFDQSLNLLAEIDDYESFYFEKSWYDAGQFKLSINKNKLYADLIDRGVLVGIAGRSDWIGIITEIEKSVNEGGHGSETITANGFDFRYTFNWRNVKPLSGQARYSIPGDITIIEDAGNPIFNYDFKVSRVMVGSTCHIFYSDAGTIYHRTATDALCNTWSAGAATNITGCYYPFVFYYSSMFYLIGHFGSEQGSMYIYSSSDGVTWTIANSGNPVFSNSTGIYTYTWGMSIAVIGSTMYFAVESATDETKSTTFGIAYSRDTFAHLTAGTCDFTTNATSTHIIPNGGSPDIIYLQNKSAFMLVHTYIDYDAVTYWQLRVSWATLTDSGTYWTPSAWTTSNNWGLSVDSTNLLYPDFIALPSDKTYGILLGYLYNSASNYQAYFDSSIDEFYDIISANIPAETVIKQLIYDQVGAGADSARQIPNMTIATDLLRGDPYVLSARYSKLFDELRDIVYATNISPQITVDYTTKGFIFDVEEGTDRTYDATSGRAIFSANFDTLKSYDSTHSDINYRNLLIVGGKGVGADRKILEYYGDGVEPTGLNRREIFVDARELEDYALATKAKNEKEKYINEDNFDIDGLEYSGLVYRTDYDVGDICTVMSMGEHYDLRLASVAEAWEHAKYTLALSFGKPYPEATKKLASSQSETASSLSATETAATASTSSSSTSYTTIQIINDELSNLNEYPLFANKLSGSVVPHADSAFTYNPYSGMLSVNKLNQAVIQYQSLKEYTIPGSTNKILQYTNLATGQTSGDIFSIFEIRSPDTSQTESTLSLHNVVSGTDDWVRDISFHNYSGSMKAVEVISHFTGTTAGSWEWVSRVTNGTDYSMVDSTIMQLDGTTENLTLGTNGGSLIVGYNPTISSGARGDLDIRSYGSKSLPAAVISTDSSYATQPNALLVKNGAAYAFSQTLVEMQLLNPSDTGVVLKLDNAGSGDCLQVANTFKLNKAGEITAGIWKGTTVAVGYGGTGQTSFTAGRILFGNDALAINSSADLVWDNTNSYLGLSVTPTERLSVAGHINQSGNYGIYNAFTSGFAGAGWRVDYGVTTAGKSSAEFDNLTIRGTMRVYELIINQIRATNGSLFVSSAAKIKTAALASGTIGVNGSTYTLTTGSSTEGAYHGFLINDVIRAQRFIWNGTGEAVVYQIDMVVTAITDLYTFTGQLVGDNSYIISIDKLVGIDLVRLGNTSNTDRQGSVYLTSDDSNSPFVDIVNGITSHADWNTASKIKARFGRLSGITSATWGTLSGYGLWSDNVYLEGAIKATSGYIGGWTIGAADLYSSGIHMVPNATAASNKIYIGTGTYNNTNTAFYVDGAGYFSLKDKLTWDGTTLSINGSGTFSGTITASAGTIGSFTIGTYLYTGSKTAYNDGLAGVHLGSDGIGISSTFTVSSEGSITATRGSIAGWTLASDALYHGTKVATGNYAAAGDITIGSDGHISAYKFRVDATGNAFFKGNLEAASISTSSALYSSDGHIAIKGDATANTFEEGIVFADYNQLTTGPSTGNMMYSINGHTESTWTGISNSLRLYNGSSWDDFYLPRITENRVISTTDSSGWWEISHRFYYSSGSRSNSISLFRSDSPGEMSTFMVSLWDSGGAGADYIFYTTGLSLDARSIFSRTGSTSSTSYTTIFPPATGESGFIVFSDAAAGGTSWGYAFYYNGGAAAGVQFVYSSTDTVIVRASTTYIQIRAESASYAMQYKTLRLL